MSSLFRLFSFLVVIYLLLLTPQGRGGVSAFKKARCQSASRRLVFSAGFASFGAAAAFTFVGDNFKVIGFNCVANFRPLAVASRKKEKKKVRKIDTGESTGEKDIQKEWYL
jgi:hypothetical protein